MRGGAIGSIFFLAFLLFQFINGENILQTPQSDSKEDISENQITSEDITSKSADNNVLEIVSESNDDKNSKEQDALKAEGLNSSGTDDELYTSTQPTLNEEEDDLNSKQLKITEDEENEENVEEKSGYSSESASASDSFSREYALPLEGYSSISPYETSNPNSQASVDSNAYYRSYPHFAPSSPSLGLGSFSSADANAQDTGYDRWNYFIPNYPPDVSSTMAQAQANSRGWSPYEPDFYKSDLSYGSSMAQADKGGWGPYGPGSYPDPSYTEGVQPEAYTSIGFYEPGQARIISPEEYIIPQSIYAQGEIVCRRAGDLYNILTIDNRCLICTCSEAFRQLRPVCVSCDSCFAAASLPLPEPEPEPLPVPIPVPSLPPPEPQLSCSPLPDDTPFQNPLNTCQICICTHVFNAIGQLDIQIDCQENPECQMPPDINPIPPIPEPPIPVPMPLCEKFPSEIFFPHPTESCKICKCVVEILSFGIPEQRIICIPNPDCEQSWPEPEFLPPGPEPGPVIEPLPPVPEPWPIPDTLPPEPEPWPNIEPLPPAPEVLPIPEPWPPAPEPWQIIEPEPWPIPDTVPQELEPSPIVEPLPPAPEAWPVPEPLPPALEPWPIIEPLPPAPEPSPDILPPETEYWPNMEPLPPAPELLPITEPWPPVPEPWQNVEPELWPIPDTLPPEPEPWPIVEPLPPVPEPWPVPEPSPPMPQPWPVLEPLPPEPEPWPVPEPSPPTLQPWPVLEPLPPEPEPFPNPNILPAEPEPWPTIEQLPPALEPWPTPELLPEQPETWPLPELSPPIPEPVPSAPEPPPLPEPWPIPEQLPPAPEPVPWPVQDTTLPQPWPMPVPEPEQLPLPLPEPEPLPWPPVLPDIPSSPLPGPSPHQSCRPYPPNMPFQHPWDECRVCVCSEFHATGITNIEVNCFTKPSCCIELPFPEPNPEPLPLPSPIQQTIPQSIQYFDSQYPAGQLAPVSQPIQYLDQSCQYQDIGSEFISPEDVCKVCTCQLFGNYVAPICRRSSRPECAVSPALAPYNNVIFIEPKCRYRIPNQPYVVDCNVCSCHPVFNYVIARCTPQPNCDILPLLVQGGTLNHAEASANAQIDSYGLADSSALAQAASNSLLSNPTEAIAMAQTLANVNPNIVDSSAYAESLSNSGNDYPFGVIFPGSPDISAPAQANALANLSPDVNSYPYYASNSYSTAESQTAEQVAYSQAMASASQTPINILGNQAYSSAEALANSQLYPGLYGGYPYYSGLADISNLQQGSLATSTLYQGLYQYPLSQMTGVYQPGMSGWENSSVEQETSPGLCKYSGDKYHHSCQACFCFQDGNGSLFTLCLGNPCTK